jgi:hypothetical protein
MIVCKVSGWVRMRFQIYGIISLLVMYYEHICTICIWDCRIQNGDLENEIIEEKNRRFGLPGLRKKVLEKYNENNPYRESHESD